MKIISTIAIAALTINDIAQILTMVCKDGGQEPLAITACCLNWR